MHPEWKETEDPFTLEPDQIRKKVKDAGIVGLGGAAFPTAVKITPPKDKPIDTVIINGCECEPILTADYRLMMEYPDEILKGAELVRIATGADRILVGIEDNKKKAFDLLQQKAAPYSADVFLVKTKYPQGAEKNLIYALLGREVPRGGLPFDVGVIVQNVGTAKAVWDAAKTGKPLYERALTVSGDGVKEPKNLIVRIGTPFQAVTDYCGGLSKDVNMIIMGGPMMGLSQWVLDVPVIKGTSGILAWASPKPITEFSCIRCGRCIEHCPMGLVPTQLMKYARYEQLSDAENWGVLDCVECGSCQYSCPANIPLVHWIRLGKSQIMSQKRKKSAK
jgi:electron transport complex protein RnfC